MNSIDGSLFVIFKCYFNSTHCLCLGFPISLFSFPIKILYVVYLAVYANIYNYHHICKVAGKNCKKWNWRKVQLQKTLPLLSQYCYSTYMVGRPWFTCCTCLIVLISNWWQNEVIFTLLFLSICHWHDRSCNWFVTNSSRGLTHNAHVCTGATMNYKRQPARMCMLPCWVRLNLSTLYTLFIII